jgi:CHASE2 domain-containing sensor protein
MLGKKRKKVARPAAGSNAATTVLAVPKKTRWRWRIVVSSLLGLSIVILFLSFIKFFDLVGLDRRLQDLLISYVGSTVSKQFDPRVKLILVDKSQQATPPYGKADPSHRKYHADLIRLLNRAGAKVVVFDVEFDTSSPEDQNFAQAIQEVQRAGTQIVVAAYLDPGQYQPQMGATLRAAIGDHWGLCDCGPTKTGNAHSIRLADEGTAQPYAGYSEQSVLPSLALQAVRMFRYPNEVTTVRSSPLASEVRVRSGGADGKLLESIPVSSEMDLLVDLPGSGEIPRKSYQDVLTHPDDYAANFKDSVVVIGYEDGDVLSFSNDKNPRYGSEMHATAISTILGGNYLRPAPVLFHYLAILLLIAITACLEIRFSKWMDKKVTISLPIALPPPFDKITIPVAVVVISFVYILIAVLAFKLGHIVFDMSYHLAALILTYYLFVFARSKFTQAKKRKTSNAP